ncbi:indolethylamine N-methyltransferase-like [Tiliqua scincoides]|uniref:indolethylamine N-methyltransferase-like n=1 Tax=Tiliqua scincoides TaxID=71010 RepID=UPI0034629696
MQQHYSKEKWAEKEELLRRTIKQVLKCDVTLPNPLAPVELPPADCLLSNLCLETACKDQPAFCSALRNISTLLKPGGHLVLFSMLEDNFYMVGQRRFFCLSLERKFLKEAVVQAGFDIKWLKETQFSIPLPTTDAKGVCATVAQKCLC